MRLRIYRLNFLKLTTVTVIIFFLIITPMESDSSLAIVFLLTTVFVLPVIIESFRNRRYLYLVFMGLLYELLLVMTLLISFAHMEETSWRSLYSSFELNSLSLKFISESLLVLVFVYYASNFIPIDKNAAADSHKVRISTSFFLCFAICADIFMAVFFLRSGAFSVRDYDNAGSSTYIVIYRIIQAAFLTLYSKGITKRTMAVKVLKHATLVSFVILDVLMGVFGYRYILVEVLLFCFFMNMDKIEKIRIKHLILAGAAGFCAYSALTVIKARIGGGWIGQPLSARKKYILYAKCHYPESIKDCKYLFKHYAELNSRNSIRGVEGKYRAYPAPKYQHGYV